MKTHLFILDGNNTIHVGSPSVTRIEHRKIEPKAKNFSHCKKNQSSWPNQIDSSKRLAKISNHAYKNLENIQIIFIVSWSEIHNSSDLGKHTAKEYYIE